MYKAIGLINGRWVYQKPGEDRYLEYGNKYWIASTGVGKTSGHIHNSGDLQTFPSTKVTLKTSYPQEVALVLSIWRLGPGRSRVRLMTSGPGCRTLTSRSSASRRPVEVMSPGTMRSLTDIRPTCCPIRDRDKVTLIF